MNARRAWRSWVLTVGLAAATIFALGAGPGAVSVPNPVVRVVPRIERRVDADGVVEIQVVERDQRPVGVGRVSTELWRYRDPVGNDSEQNPWRAARLRVGPFQFVRSARWQGRLLWLEAWTRNVDLVLAVDAYGRVAEVLLAPFGTRFLQYERLTTGDIIATVDVKWGFAPGSESGVDPRGVWLLPPNAASEPSRLPGRRFVVSPDRSRAVLLGQAGPALLFDAATRQMSPLLQVPNRWSTVSPPGVTWLADGQTVLVVREIRGRFDSALVDVFRDRFLRVWDSDDEFVVADASPDGRYIGIARMEPADAVWVGPAVYPQPVGREIEFLDVVTGRSWTFRTERDEERVMEPPIWSADGVWFVTGRPLDRPPEPGTRPNPYRLWWIGYDGARRTFEPISRVPNFKRLLGVSPTGRYAAIEAWRSGLSDLLVFDRDTEAITRLRARSYVSWLADDRILVRRIADPGWSDEVFAPSGVWLGEFGEGLVVVSPDGGAVAISRFGRPLTYLVVAPNPLR